MNETQRTELEATVFRRLVDHLRTHTEVQNIELMIVADFCRNCLAKWYHAAAQELGMTELTYADALQAIYGMPYEEWKSRFQTPATPEQLKKLEEIQRRKEQQGH
ncbi:MAG TPA: DUF1244 domain-containing protein [Methylococcus sp.]|nr:DUF1244 domain-containing protein [Methylococcus sp.]